MKEEDKIEILSDKFLVDLPLEQPSANFSNKIMEQLQESTIDPSYFTYKPLINKWGWAGIFSLIAGIFYYSVIFSERRFSMQSFDLYLKKIQPFLQVNPFQEIHQMPELFIYIMLIFSFMTLIEITILKKIFNYRSSL